MFAVPDFLAPGEREGIDREMRDGESVPARLVDFETGENAVDERYRRTRTVRVTRATEEEVSMKLTTLRPDLERHFHVSLQNHVGPQFLLYRTGDFFVPHTDTSEHGDRRVSIIVFLSRKGTASGDGEYGGGDIVFGGKANPNRPGTSLGLPFPAEPGLLVAFRPDLLHEIRPVTWGTRCTIVTWFV